MSNRERLVILLAGILLEHFSPFRLLRRRLELPGDITVSVEKLNGRLLVRVDQPVR